MCRLRPKQREALVAVITDETSRTDMRITARQWRELAEQVELLDRIDLNAHRSPLMRLAGRGQPKVSSAAASA
jgi:hypothetical protein